ncbi:MAG: cytochrome c [Methanothrix sp.]|nr:cytochrome c [Methanothrix sp.]
MAIAAQAADVKQVWEENCAKCHGPDGKGKTRMGQKLGVRDYTDSTVQASVKDEDAAKAIKEGVKQDGKEKMKGFGDKLSDQEIKDLVAHIRSFKK